MADVNEELVIEYAVVRRTRPLADADEIAERITDRLSDGQLLALAQDALLWHHKPAERRELALLAARNFLHAMEDDPEAHSS